MRVLVLGSTGMLGAQVVMKLRESGINVIGTSRRDSHLESHTVPFDARSNSLEELIDSSGSFDYVINAIGIIKPYIKDGNAESELQAIEINSLFPHKLAQAAEANKFKVIQIATDCVYSGNTGNYLESSPHDALDVYGKTKSLGEVNSPNVMHLRCSIIGREFGRSTSLVEWVLGQEQNSTITGYSDHLWNGVTTNVFGGIAAGVIKDSLFQAGIQHLVPSDQISKFDLVSEIATVGNRKDIQIEKSPAPAKIDRTLQTLNHEFNSSLWASAGFSRIPTVKEIVQTLAS